MNRYVVTCPVPHGHAWFQVADRQSQVMQNFAVASFSVHLPGAKEIAERLCAQLNTSTKPAAELAALQEASWRWAEGGGDPQVFQPCHHCGAPGAYPIGCLLPGNWRCYRCGNVPTEKVSP